MVSLLLCSCSLDWWLGDGRGDWTVDLFEGYAVSKINSREIILVHKDDPDATGGSIILPNFFVTAYQLHKPYVCIEGFFTTWNIKRGSARNHSVCCYVIVIFRIDLGV